MTLSKIEHPQPFSYVRISRHKLIVGLVCSIIAANSFLFMQLNKSAETIVENIVSPITALSAVIAAVVVVARQKLDGLFGRAYFFLAVGLVFWCTAEFIWSYYVLIEGEESPFPSLADAFWLVAYSAFGYHMASMYKFYRPRTNIATAAAVSIAVAVFTAIYSLDILGRADVSDSEATISTLISLAYPILDGLILIPAILVVIGNSGKGILTALPLIFISWILTTIADTLFGYTAVANLIGEFTIWNLFYNAAYLCMAAGLIWHNKFFIIDDKKGEKLWAAINR